MTAPDYCSRTITQRYLSFDIIPLETASEENCLSDDLSLKLLPLGQMVLRKTVPQKNNPKDKLHPRYFSPKNQKSQYIDRQLFPLLALFTLCFRLVLDFDFCKRKNFINLMRLRLKIKSRTNLVWNNETDLFLLSQQID